MDTQPFDVIIIGAGAAGLIAALEIALTGRSVAVVEANAGSGGRMRTTTCSNNYPVELGAEFVHGKLPITLGLVKKAGAKTHPVGGSIWQHKANELKEQEDFIEDYSDLEKKFAELREDSPVADFLAKHLAGDKYEELRFSLTNYVQGYYAADLTKASTFALRDELSKEDEEQYRIEGGYKILIDYLEEQCREKGVQFFFSQIVKELQWKKGEATVITPQSSFRVKKALVTVSIGVLQAQSIVFSPALPKKSEAAKGLGFGQVQKIIFCFRDAFWKDKTVTGGKDLHDLNFLFSEEEIPTWWTQHPNEEAVLVGWLGGPPATNWADATKDFMEQKAIQSLAKIFGLSKDLLRQKLSSTHFHNWASDEYFLGAYSYEVVNGEAYMKTILQPVDDTLYFAGEGLHHGPQIGTVEAALHSGQTVARQLIAAF